MHIIHGFQHMTHQAESCPFQIMKNFGDVTPVCYFFFGLLISMECADNDIVYLFPHPDSHTSKLGNGTDIIVFKLDSCASVAQVKRLTRLQSNKNHRLFHVPYDWGKN